MPYPKLITFKGKKKTTRQWASQFGISSQTLHGRLKSKNWSLEKVMQPKMKGGNKTGSHRLSPDDIKEIQNLYATGEFTCVALAQLFDRDHTTILHHCKNIVKKIIQKELTLKQELKRRSYKLKLIMPKRKQHNVPKYYTPTPTKSYDDYKKEAERRDGMTQQMIRLRTAGWTIKQIACKFNLHSGKVAYILKKHGADSKYYLEMKASRDSVLN